MLKLWLAVRSFLILAILIAWSIFAFGLWENRVYLEIKEEKKELISRRVEDKKIINYQEEALGLWRTLHSEGKKLVYDLMINKFPRVDPNRIANIVY